MLTSQGIEYLYQAAIKYQQLSVILYSGNNEADFPGYARKILDPYLAKLDAEGYLYFDTIQFELLSKMDNYPITGSAIVAADDTIIEKDILDIPIILRWQGDIAKITKRLYFTITKD